MEAFKWECESGNVEVEALKWISLSDIEGQSHSKFGFCNNICYYLFSSLIVKKVFVFVHK